MLELRYGLQDGVERNLAEVGRELGITRERARQIEREALGKLREESRDDPYGRLSELAIAYFVPDRAGSSPLPFPSPATSQRFFLSGQLWDVAVGAIIAVRPGPASGGWVQAVTIYSRDRNT